MQATSPAHIYATVVGAFLAILGIAGFFYESSFATGDGGVRSGEVLGIIAVNGWTNLLHVVCGLILLGAAAAGSARSWALGFGLLFVILAIWGFIAGDPILSLLAVNTGTGIVHLIVGLLGLGAAVASPPRRSMSGR